MMQLKVHCDCGQKFKFDVDPSNEQMPFTVACPACGRDGTRKANSQLQARAATPSQTVASSSAINPLSAPAAAPSALRINTGNPAPMVGEEPATAPLSEGSSDETAPEPAAVKKPSFGKGLLGGLVGVLIGALVYFLVLKFCGPQFRIVAKFLSLGVGGLAGWFAELFGKGEGSKELGAITAALVLGGLIGAQYLVVLGWWHDKTIHFGTLNNSPYDASVRMAQVMVQDIPTGSDEEIRNYLAHLYDKAGAHLDPQNIRQQEIEDVRASLPVMRDLASGKITEAAYNNDNGIDAAKESENQQEDFKSFFALWLFSRSSLFALAGAAGLAYKLSTNA